jgi:hypothetical protein
VVRNFTGFGVVYDMQALPGEREVSLRGYADTVGQPWHLIMSEGLGATSRRMSRRALRPREGEAEAT